MSSMGVRFIASPSRMGDKIIIIIPKRFHKGIKPLLKRQLGIFLADALAKQKASNIAYIGSVSPMGKQYIVYVPKHQHDNVKPLIGQYTAVVLKEAI